MKTGDDEGPLMYDVSYSIYFIGTTSYAIDVDVMKYIFCIRTTDCPKLYTPTTRQNSERIMKKIASADTFLTRIYNVRAILYAARTHAAVHIHSCTYIYYIPVRIYIYIYINIV